MKKYSEYEMKQKLDNYLTNNPDGVFYRDKMLRYNGQSTEYSEIIAEWLYKNQLNDPEAVDSLLLNGSHMRAEKEFTSEPIHKVSDVRFSHYAPNTRNKRNEENIAKRLFQQGASITHDATGNVIPIVDYQVPVNRAASSREGKVDLVLKDGIVCLLGELKDDKSPETMLRAVVEAKTYARKIETSADASARFNKCYNTKGVLPAVLFFEGTAPYYDFQKMKKGSGKYMAHLCAIWDVIFILVEPDKNNVAFDFENNSYSLKQVWLY